MGICVFDMAWLRAALKGDGTDFGHHLLPDAVRQEAAFCYRAAADDGRAIYWRDVGTLDAFCDTALELRSPGLASIADPTGSCAMRAEHDHLLPFGTFAFPGASVGRGARLRKAIVAPGVRLGPDECIGFDRRADAPWFRVTKGGTTLITKEMVGRRDAARTPWRRPVHARGAPPVPPSVFSRKGLPS
jgi:ADP-glucose pyrophosphorylase